MPCSTPTSLFPATTMAAFPPTVVACTRYPSFPTAVRLLPSARPLTSVDEVGVPRTTAPAAVGWSTTGIVIPMRPLSPLTSSAWAACSVAELPAVTIWVRPAWYSARRAGRLTFG